MTPRPVLLVLLVSLIAIAKHSPAAVPERKPAADFTLTDPAGKSWTLHEQKAKGIVVAFLATECPMSNGYLPVLSELNMKYAEKGVVVVGVFPDPETTTKRVAAHAKEYKIRFPVFADPGQASVASLGAKITPEVVLLDDKFAVRYRGRIDDGYAGRLKPRPSVTRHDLREAIDQLLAGNPVSVAETKPFGCPIELARKKAGASSTITFYKDVLPVFAAHCQGCHRPGQIGPFALTTYKEAAKWGELCLEEVKSKRMPPWKPAPNHLLAGERSLPPEAAHVIEAWVANGMPEGNPKDAPPPAKYSDGWTFGEPDLILEAPFETTVAATGRDHFRVIVFPTHFDEDKYIVAMEVKPGNPRVVHHTIQLIDNLGVARKLQAEAQAKAKPDDPDRGPGFRVNMGLGFLADPAGLVGGWAPGMLPKKLPDGV
ncbi:MAG TPA: redoxin domain-containing protein, partial [Gemmata sp.]|nr:redoxin domain-containing protein [Gemmata sp.]